MIINMSIPMTTDRLPPGAFERIAKALADPQRCDILQRFAGASELCCSNIVAECAVSQATISHHLKELVIAGLLERRKDGQFAYYRFLPDTMSAYVKELEQRLQLGPRAGKRAAAR